MENKWREHLIQFLISGLTGGLVGLIVIWIYLPKKGTHLEELEVDSLVVRQKLTVRADGNDGDALLVKDGSLFVKNRVVATQFLGSQIASSIVVSNRQLTTPDDIFATPPEQWRFYTELGGSTDDGGEILVRSRNGANSIGKSLDDGVMIRVGFDPTESTQLVTHNFRTNNTQALMTPRSRRATDDTTPRLHSSETATQIASQFLPVFSPHAADATKNDFATAPLAETNSASAEKISLPHAPSHVNARVRTPETTSKTAPEPSDSLPLLNSSPLAPLTPVAPLSPLTSTESLPPLPILEPISTAPSFSPLR